MTVILAILKTYWLQIALVVGGVALGFSAAWQWQGLRLDSLELEFGQYRNQVEQQALEARQAAVKQQEQWLKEKEDAEVKAAEREAKLKKDLAAAQSVGRGLRDDLAAARDRLSESSAEACRAYVGALTDVLSECSDRYIAVAGAADQCISDFQQVSEAWPK